MAWKALPKKCQRSLDEPTIARVQQPRGVKSRRSRQTTGPPDRADSLPKKQTGQAVCPAVVGGLLPPPGNQRKPGQQQARYDEEPDHPSRQRSRPRQEAGKVSSTEVGLTTLAYERVRKRGNWEGVYRLRVEPWSEPAFSPRRGSRPDPGLGQDNRTHGQRPRCHS
jgi:hypothetical protein